LRRWLGRTVALAALALPTTARAQDDTWLAPARAALESDGQRFVERGFWMDTTLVTESLARNERRFFSTVLAAGEYHILGVCEGCDDFALIATDSARTLGTSQLVSDPHVAFVLTQPTRVRLEVWMEGCLKGDPCRFALATFMIVSGGGRSAAQPSVRGDPRDLLTQHERVDVVRPLVRVDRLQVRHVAHGVVLDQDPVRAQ
jgi:hypothetical protein